MTQLNNQQFLYWILVKHEGEIQLAGTQRLPDKGSDQNTAFVFFPFKDDFDKITNDEIIFKVNVKPKP